MKSIRIATLGERDEVKSHFDEYLKELSQFDPKIKFDKNGVPIYKWFDCYFEDDDRFLFLLSEGEKFMGLAMVRELEEKHYEIAEFYVAPEYRKDNNALDFAKDVVKRFGGAFSFSTRLENKRAIAFWDKFVKSFHESTSQICGGNKEWNVAIEAEKDIL